MEALACVLKQNRLYFSSSLTPADYYSRFHLRVHNEPLIPSKREVFLNASASFGSDTELTWTVVGGEGWRGGAGDDAELGASVGEDEISRTRQCNGKKNLNTPNPSGHEL